MENKFVWTDELVKQFAHHVKKIFTLNNNYCGKYDSFDTDFNKWKEAFSTKLLFTTADNEKVYGGDHYFYVQPSFSIDKYYASEEGRYPKNYTAKCFARTETAEEYVINNKPILSVSDVVKMYDGLILDFSSDPLEKHLKELAKTKL